MESKYLTQIEKKDNEINYEQERKNYFCNKMKELEESLNSMTSGKLVITSEA